MLAGMTPVLKDGTYFFCTTNDLDIVAAVAGSSLALFREDEGVTLVLSRADATRHGFNLSLPMCRIVLEVHSALDGVGLTAGVAAALADEDIACNMIAAYHHDNLFVPEPMGRRALSILQNVQRKARRGT